MKPMIQTYNEEPDGVNNDRDGTIVVSFIMFNTVHTPTLVINIVQNYIWP